MNSKLSLSGAFTALVTPFTSDARGLDVEAFETLVQSQLDAGISGLVPCGTTGESPTLSDQEKYEIISRTARFAKGKVPILAGSGSNCTETSIHSSQAALEAGADAVMIVMPYYNKPSQEGMFQHVTTIAKQIGGAPVVLYNIPGRSVVDLHTDTLARIVDVCPNVVALKDATGNVVRCQEVACRFGDDLAVMSGDDGITLGMMASGAKGVISVTSNLYPDRVAAVCRAVESGDLALAKKLHFSLLPVHGVMFVEPNPGPVKAALAHKNRIHLALRLPLCSPSQANRKLVVDTITAYDARTR
ncbi:MAG: 4-hydroxy-tetrahydrodipicolinate synthase [Sorangium cellulosum]|nr:MAG: 4-hydroxy-tetrahydrodipicolinate synthase [Sorangium cellulosum]